MQVPHKSLLRFFIMAAVSGIVAGLLTVNDRTVSDKPIVLKGLRSPRSLAAISDGSVLVSEVLGGRLLRLIANSGVEVTQEGLPSPLGRPRRKLPPAASAAVLVEDT